MHPCGLELAIALGTFATHFVLLPRLPSLLPHSHLTCHLSSKICHCCQNLLYTATSLMYPLETTCTLDRVSSDSFVTHSTRPFAWFFGDYPTFSCYHYFRLSYIHF